MKKVLRVEDVPKKTVEDVPAKGGGGFLSIHQLLDGKLNLSDKDYCIRFGNEVDWKELRARIAERRKTEPAFLWARCKNPKCGWTGKMRADTPVGHCFHCNWPGYREHPGWLEKVTSKKEVEALERAAADRLDRGTRRAFKAGLFNRNQERQKDGLPPLSEKEYRAEQKSEWERLNRPTR